MTDSTPDGGSGGQPGGDEPSPQSQGGTKRAEKLSPAERTAIARQAALSRWKGALPYATHEGPLVLAGNDVRCAVLNTTVRVLTQESFLTSMGRSPKAPGGTGIYGGSEVVEGLPPFLSAENLKPFVSDKLRQSTTPIMFKSKSGHAAMGFDARLLPMVCDVYIRAGLARKLTKVQRPIADRCREIQHEFAEVGIVALVDDASGYAHDRAKDELAKLLEAYIVPELLPYASKFPNEFFRQVYRLHGWEYKPGVTRGPRYVGKFIMEYVWGGLPKEVVDKIKELNPNNEKGQRKRKLFQFLTDETGIPHLDWQISTVSTLMRAAIDKEQFKELYGRAFSKQLQTQMRLTFTEQPKELPDQT
jgi:hypothetical protein